MPSTEPGSPGTLHEPARELPVSHQTDVVVCGAGPAGTAAAICASRLGLKTVLVEYSSIPGGMLTHQNCWLNDFDNKGGFPGEFYDYITDSKIREGHYYNPFLVLPWLDEQIARAGVRPLYLAQAVAPILEENTLRGVIMESKSGRTAILARVVIDATGDGDIAARAGAGFEIGRASDGACQAVTASFFLTNYTGGRIERPEMAELARQAGKKADTGYELPYDKWHTVVLPQTTGVIKAGVPHATGFDVLSVDGLSDCLIELRRQMVEMYRTLKENTEEFRTAELGGFPAIPGVRESRRIVCEEKVTYTDIQTGRKRPDGLFTVTQGVDIHRCRPGEPSIRFEAVQPYHLPFGALIPKGLDNILVIGRCIDGEHRSLASYRIMADCMAMGEAAAIACRSILDHNCATREVPISALAREMRRRGYEI